MYIIDKFKILTYNIGFISKGLERSMNEGIGRGDIQWMQHPYRDRFFADPFLLRIDTDNLYILCEEMTFWEEKGKIVLLTVDRHSYKLKRRSVLIEEPYHLSFPFCELNGDWVVPEACKSGQTFAYKFDLSKQKIAEKIKIVDEGLVDNVYYQAQDGSIWLYTGKTKIPSTELYEYKLSDDGFFQQTVQEPIESDHRHTRGAGRFFSYRGKLYRPVQDCEGRYGRQTKIMEILSVGKDGYAAREVCTLNSFQNPPFDETMHTFNVYEEIIIVDGSKDFLRFPMKFFYKKCSWIFKGRLKR